MKKLFLFTLICSLGFFTACSDDDDNDTPTPTPPEVNLAKEIEGLYNADLFLTYESAQDTSDQTINFFPQGKDYVKLKTSNINYKIGKNTIGSIEIDSIPVANSFSKAADHNIYFKITNKKVRRNDRQWKRKYRRRSHPVPVETPKYRSDRRPEFQRPANDERSAGNPEDDLR